MLQPPVIETAIHLLEVLKDAEAVAAEAAPTNEKDEFVAFDDTYVMYAYLVGFHMSGAIRFSSVATRFAAHTPRKFPKPCRSRRGDSVPAVGGRSVCPGRCAAPPADVLVWGWQ